MMDYGDLLARLRGATPESIPDPVEPGAQDTNAAPGWRGVRDAALSQVATSGSPAEALARKFAPDFNAPPNPSDPVKVPEGVPPRDVLKYLGAEAAGGNFTMPAYGLHTVFHGTPATWPAEPGAPLGQFRKQYRGTGEGGGYVGGGEMKGAGAYVAEAAPTGESYRTGLAKPEVRPMSKAAQPVAPAQVDAFDYLRRSIEGLHQEYGSVPSAGKALEQWRTDLAEMAESARDRANRARGWHEGKPQFAEDIAKYGETPIEDVLRAEAEAQKAESAAQWAKGLGPQDIDVSGGSLYHLDFPDELLPKVLDFDAPMSAQTPEVQQALRPMFQTMKDGRVILVDPADPSAAGRVVADSADSLSGESIYHALVNRHGGRGDAVASEAASAALRDAGIPAHKFLDAGSRSRRYQTHFAGKPLDSEAFVGLPGLEQNALNAFDNVYAYAPDASREEATRRAWDMLDNMSRGADKATRQAQLEALHSVAARVESREIPGSRNFVVYEPDKHLKTMARYGSLMEMLAKKEPQ